jgi:hypothetical protein
MAERNEKGHFLPGNQTSKKGGRESHAIDKKKLCRNEIIKCALSLSKPTSTLMLEMHDKDATRLESLTAQAIHSKNYKFIQWLLEMAVGRPHQALDDSIVEINNGRTLKEETDEELQHKFKMIMRGN